MSKAHFDFRTPGHVVIGGGLDGVITLGVGDVGVLTIGDGQTAAASTPAEAPASVLDEDTVLTAASELLWHAVDEWAHDGLGEPGAHLADIRRRLAGV
jgi:hypothetical protein